MAGITTQVGRFRRNLGRFLGESWREVLALVLLLLLARLLFVGSRPILEQVMLLGLFLVLVGLLVWPRVSGIFGPVFFYDAVRLGRRGRYILLRCLYALLLFALLLALCIQAGDVATLARPNQRALSRFAETFFFAFMC